MKPVSTGKISFAIRMVFAAGLVLSFLPLSMCGQLLGNPSLEGATNVLPPLPWSVCGGTPDNQILSGTGTGIFAINTPAQDGISYIGMVTSSYGYIEAIGQPVSLLAGTAYNGSIALFRSTLHSSWDGTGRCQIWGGTSCNNIVELLWTSPTITNVNNWQNYPISFAPTMNHSFIIFVNYLNTGTGMTNYFCMDDIVLETVILPVEMISFEAADGPGGVALAWETAPLDAPGSFEVEWSPDALTFEQIATVTGIAGDDHFQVLHPHPQPGMNYYRLRMVDVNGAETFSGIRQVEHEKDHLVSVYPNPGSGRLNLSLRLYKPVRVEVRATDVAGCLVFRDVRDLPSGNQVMTLDAARKLPGGIYHLEIRMGDEFVREKVIIQK